MNPFLEPTVATPRPDARWRRPTSQTPGLKVPAPKAPSMDVGAPTNRSVRRRRAIQGRAGATLRMLTMVGALILPGWSHAVDINTATVQQLQEVKGIGPKTAALIVEERERGGGFESMTDVSERVKGIGPKKAASLEAAGLKVGAASGGTAETARPARRGR